MASAMRRVILVTSHDEARASARAYWLSREPWERLAAVEFLKRQQGGATTLVVGAYALAPHGAPRFTGDINILIRPTRENAERVLEAICASWFPTDSISADRLQRPEALGEMGVPPPQIRVMSEISGVSWDAAWTGRAEVSLRDGRLNVIGRGRASHEGAGVA